MPLPGDRSRSPASPRRPLGRALVAMGVAVASLGAGGVAHANDFTLPDDPPIPRTTREVIRAESARTGVSLDAGTLFGKLVDRYRGLALYQDSVKLAHRTIAAEPELPSVAVSQSMGCTVDGSTLAVISSALGTGGSCDTRDASPIAKVELARQLWTLPHLALRFADEPLRSMRGGCGTLVPTRVEEVTIDERPLLRLHLESARPADGEEGSCEESTVDFFVNPHSLLVERVEHSHTIAEGVRYEATLEITPERAVSAPAAPETPTSTPSAPAAPPQPTVAPPTAQPSMSPPTS